MFFYGFGQVLLRFSMLAQSLVHHSQVVVQLSLFLKRLFLLDHFQNMQGFISLSLLFKTNRKIRANFQKCWLRGRIRHGRSLLSPGRRDLHYLLVCFLIKVHGAFSLILLVVNDANVKVSL